MPPALVIPSFLTTSLVSMVGKHHSTRILSLSTPENVDKTLQVHLKSRPNDCNTPTQHITTLLGGTCRVRLATLLRCVGCCWLKFEAGQI